jgi:hypothetical protein
MPADIQRLDEAKDFRTLHYDDPLVIGVSALILGYVIGSGRWKWLGQELSKIAGSIGSLAVNSLSESVQERNPQLFERRSRVTH